MANERRLSFGGVAEAYDRARPTYPDAMIDDLVGLAELTPGQQVLEVGAGTGKATAQFLTRGIRVLALEPSAEMAAILRRNSASLGDVTVEQMDFEHWQGAGARFPLVYSAQAWHWVTPVVRYQRARAALADGGWLAVFWNWVVWEGHPLREELNAAYRREAPELEGDGPMQPAISKLPSDWDEWLAEVAAAPGLGQPEQRSYPWTQEYSTREYVELLATHSDHVLLPPDRRASLLAAIADVLDAHGGRFEVDYVTRLCLARAV